MLIFGVFLIVYAFFGAMNKKKEKINQLEEKVAYAEDLLEKKREEAKARLIDNKDEEEQAEDEAEKDLEGKEIKSEHKEPNTSEEKPEEKLADNKEEQIQSDETKNIEDTIGKTEESLEKESKEKLVILNDDKVSFYITEGMTSEQIADLLQSKGIVEASVFNKRAEERKVSTRLLSGQFTVEKNIDVDELITILSTIYR